MTNLINKKTMLHCAILLLLITTGSDCNDDCEPYMLSSPPGLEFTSVPPIGSDGFLVGRVKGVEPTEYRVAVYIFVPGVSPEGWWNKAYFDKPLTEPECTSNFNCDITTGGHDDEATKIRAYLVSKYYNPPLVSGSIIPESILQNTLSWIEVSR